jgi:hypothetical protein
MSQTQVQSGFIGDNAVTTDKIAAGAVTSAKLETNSNGKGKRTVSTSLPSGGSDGDIWYVV